MYILDNLKSSSIVIYGRKKLCYYVLCSFCNKEHPKEKSDLIKGNKRNNKYYCSENCRNLGSKTAKEINCTQCNANFTRYLNQIRKTKNSFCSRHCAVTYNNLHKTHGCRRSKLEQFLEQKLKINFPKLNFLSNDKTTIGSELDFYFPDLKLAIQYNGPTHYKPIYGDKKFQSIVKFDIEKLLKCYLLDINLIEIDCSSDKRPTKCHDKHWHDLKNFLSGQ